MVTWLHALLLFVLPGVVLVLLLMLVLVVVVAVVVLVLQVLALLHAGYAFGLHCPEGLEGVPAPRGAGNCCIFIISVAASDESEPELGEQAVLLQNVKTPCCS